MHSAVREPLDGRDFLETDAEIGDDGKLHVTGFPGGRLSNFGPADLYSVQSSRGPTPRPSNFEENCAPMATNSSPRFGFYPAQTVPTSYPAPNPEFSSTVSTKNTKNLQQQQQEQQQQPQQQNSKANHDAKELHIQNAKPLPTPRCYAKFTMLPYMYEDSLRDKDRDKIYAQLSLQPVNSVSLTVYRYPTSHLHAIVNKVWQFSYRGLLVDLTEFCALTILKLPGTAMCLANLKFG
ncbi:auxin efflux carrier component 3-like [Manihot esculenta]|uniref:auxin efflux carrier component 3-like n=1 Tax=Manihot esculenta TaxID=3983 RepID=UPI000B5D60EF|nr:auxin efflux carrier component 3-like [Manihot esculenta]